MSETLLLDTENNRPVNPESFNDLLNEASNREKPTVAGIFGFSIQQPKARLPILSGTSATFVFPSMCRTVFGGSERRKQV